MKDLTRLCRKNIFKRDKGYCRICGLRIESLDESGIAHIVLPSKGGEWHYDNMVAAHIECIKARVNYDIPLKILPIHVKIEDRNW